MRKFIGWHTQAPSKGNYLKETIRFYIDWSDGKSTKAYSIRTDESGKKYLRGCRATLWETEGCICPNCDILLNALNNGCLYYVTNIRTPPRKGRAPISLGRHTINLNTIAFDLKRRVHISPSDEKQIKIWTSEMKVL